MKLLILSDLHLEFSDSAAQQRLLTVIQSLTGGMLNSEWGRTMVENMGKMARDEECRKTIAKDLDVS